MQLFSITVNIIWTYENENVEKIHELAFQGLKIVWLINLETKAKDWNTCNVDEDTSSQSV